VHNQADEPDGKNDAVLPKGRASLKDVWPAGYPQTLAHRWAILSIKNETRNHS